MANNKFDKVRMVNQMAQWIERFDQRLNAGQQIAVAEEIQHRFSKEPELKTAFDELVAQIKDY